MQAEERQKLLNWLYSLENFGIKLGLENMKKLLDRLGNPQEKYRTVHVAGTNGKGSVCALVASILTAEGYVTGLYTSPHFVDFEERIKINGKCISEDELVEYAGKVRGALFQIFGDNSRDMTFFEITTAIAFLYFAERNVEFAVIEVGLGGRLDATNVIVPEVAAITHIALEHTQYLGNTLTSIAFEKGGIIKKRVPVISAETRAEPLNELKRIASVNETVLEDAHRLVDIEVIEKGLGLLRFNAYGLAEYRNLMCPLWGAYQIPNIKLSIAAVEKLQQLGTYISNGAVTKGVSTVFWPGRLQLAGREMTFIFDSAHNPDAAQALAASILEVTDEKFLCVIGVLSDKNLDGIMDNLVSVSDGFICASPSSSRSRPASELVASAVRRGKIAVEAPDVGDAMRMALESARGRKVIVTGSLRTVGEAMKWWSDTYGEKLWKQE
ncbi:MAG: bifunctional folylpolyglutamate synthase/dihydrofolate synthase [Thermoplasmata archaeon YP2-bin.285]|nr:bifunctional folylpolyglutamate synthase/dihydrofolate synthase [Candidatus Sysuiplasma superficiale]